MSVRLRHPLTREVRVQPEGWSWGGFLGCGFLGVPLFRRGLPAWGAVVLAFNVAALVVSWAPSARAAGLAGWVTMAGLGLSVFLGLNANRMAINRYLARGWEVAEPQSGARADFSLMQRSSRQ
jgi:hypothetical protein